MKRSYLLSGLAIACTAALFWFPALKEQLVAELRPQVSDRSGEDEPNLASLSTLKAQADELIDRGDFAGALAALNRAIAMHNEDASLVGVWKDRAFVRTKLDDRKGALEDINKAITFGANSDWTWSMRGRLHLELGDVHSAIPDLGTVLDRNPDHCHALRRIRYVVEPIEKLARKGRYILIDVNDQGKKYDIEALVSRHLAAAAGGAYQEAIGILDRLIEIVELPEFLMLQRAKLNARRGEFDVAISELDNLSHSNGFYEEMLQDQIDRSIKLEAGGNDCAGDEVRLAANDLIFFSEKIMEEKVLALVGKDDLQAALQTLDAWLTTKPTDNKRWTWRGNLLAELGHRDQALASYANALRLIDTREGTSHRDDWLHLETLFQIKAIYNDMGRSDEVFAIFEESLMRADNSLYWNLREMMNIAGHYEGELHGGSYEETISAVKECIADMACDWQDIRPEMTHQRQYRGKGSILRH